MAQGNYGTESRPLESLTGELWYLEPRTSDPTGTDNGIWLRTDLTSGDKIATIRWDDGGTTNDVPVFATSETTDSNVSKVLRIQLSGQVGFVPVSNVSAAYPELTLQHAGTEYGWHNALTATSVPDAVIDDFEDNNLSEYSSTTGINITTSNVIEGTYALNMTTNVGDFDIHSNPGDGLAYYPNKGDKFSVLLRATSNGWPLFAFGHNGSQSYYGIGPNPNTGEITLIKFVAGTFSSVTSDATALAADTYFDYVIEWHDGSGSQPDNTIEVTVYSVDTSANLTAELGHDTQQTNFTATDSDNAANSGIGFGSVGSNTSDAYFDRIWYLGDVE